MKIINLNLWFFSYLLFLFPNSSYSMIGDADSYAFNYTTKFGNSIHWDFSARSIRLGVSGGNYEVFGLKTWFFYQNNIIGTCSCRANNLTSTNSNDRCHFIGDEKEKKIDVFTDTKEWSKEVNARNLKPIFTRYYTTHYDSTAFLFRIFFLTPLVIFPIGMLILSVVIVGKAIAVEKFNRQETNTRLTMVMLFIFGLIILNSIKNIILGVQSI
ncbi:MAG: hypothetical protein AB8G22_19740 [Saprospiraceae bacterium]